MKIGIDIDGVLTDFARWQIETSSKYYYDKYNLEIKNSNAYEIKDIYEVTQEQQNDYWESYLYDYVTKEPARNYAAEVIQKLKQDGNQIYIITARTYSGYDTELGQKSRDIVFKWLKENNIYYDDIFFVKKDKLKICTELKIDVMIEDYVPNIEQLSKYMHVICFDAPYNKECSGPSIKRVYSWYDVYSKINTVNDKEELIQ